MRKPFLALVALCFLPLGALAEDVAVITLRIGKDKTPRRVVLELYEGDAPGTVENFKELAGDGFYKGLLVHRIFPNVLVQLGDPLSTKKDRSRIGTGGPGHTLAPEIKRRHTAGAVAMARLPDNINPARRSSGSQFYICLKPLPDYDGKYTVFAQVIEGLDVLQQISNLPADSNDFPIDRVLIRSVRILPREKAGT